MLEDRGEGSEAEAARRLAEARRAKAAVERWFWVGWLQRKLEVAYEAFTPDVVLHFPGGDIHGIEAMQEAARSVTDLEDLWGHAEILCEGEEFVGTYVIRGRHVKPYLGAEPTGRILEVTSVVTMRSRGDRIAELWETGRFRYLDEDEGVSEPWEAVYPRAWALTRREAQVARLAMLGYGDKRIAAELELAPASVHKYMRMVLRKAGVGCRGELAEAFGLVRIG